MMASGPGYEDVPPPFNVVVKTMFGEHFELTVSNSDSIKAVKQKITSKLNISEEGFTLLYNTRELTDGSVEENEISKDSQLTLALRIQTGMKGFATVTNPFLTIDQSLNHLSDKQIDEFLTGKVPLSVALRLGDTMLVINIQSSLATKEDEEMDNSRVDTEDMCDAQATSNTVLPNTLNCTGFPLYASDGCDNITECGGTASSSERLLNSARRDTIKNTLYDMLNRMFPDGIQTLQQVKNLRPGEILNNKTGKVTYQVKQNQDMIKLNQVDKHASVLTKSKFEENQRLREKVALLKQKMTMERTKKKAQRGTGYSPCGWLEKSLQKHSQAAVPIVHVQKRQGYCGLKRGFLLTD